MTSAPPVPTPSGPLVPGLPQTAPADEANRELVAHVHPLDWRNPEPSGRYNLVVVGGGTAGLVTAAGAAGLGAKVALVERALLGGDCLNVGCVPSKVLIEAARAVGTARRADELGVRVGGVEVDFAAVMARMRRLRAGIAHHDSASRFASLGVDVFLGDARFTGADTVEVGGTALRFARACIATGARALVPPIPGLAEAGPLTNETVFSLTELPPRLAVLGAGPIGCELAQAFARFGSRVTLVEMADRVLPREDADGAGVVAAALVADGVELRVGSRLVRVESRPEGKALLLEGAEGAGELAVDALLVAVGRAPNVEGLGLEAAGVAHGKGGVVVDDRLRTSNRRIYAAGDVCLDHKFTHTADASARIVLRNALFFGRAKASDLVVPWCTYTDPELAHVGIGPGEAAARGLEIETVRIDLAGVDRAILGGETAGFLKVHVDRKGRVVGGTMVAPHAGETISELTVAIRAGLSLSALADVIHPYPTVAEAVRKAGDAYNRRRLTPTVARLFRGLMRLRR